MSAPHDPGLQLERTLLSWRRTCLAVGLCLAVGIRVTAPDFGGFAVGVGAIGLAVTGVAYAAIFSRYGRAHREMALRSQSSSDGGPLVLTTTAVATVAMLGLAYITTRTWS